MTNSKSKIILNEDPAEVIRSHFSENLGHEVNLCLSCHVESLGDGTPNENAAGKRSIGRICIATSAADLAIGQCTTGMDLVDIIFRELKLLWNAGISVFAHDGIATCWLADSKSTIIHETPGVELA